MPLILLDPHHRYTFPSGRLTVLRSPARNGSSMTSARGMVFTVWGDESLSIPADIQLPDGTPYPEPEVTITAESLVPRFLGPPGVAILWLYNPTMEVIEVMAQPEMDQVPSPGPPTIIDGGTP